MQVKLGLRVRFFLYSNTLIVVTMTLVAVLGAMYQRRTLFDAIVGRGRSIVESMAVPITYVEGREHIGAGERGLIERYIAEVMARNQDLMRYVMVTDGAGIVTHSSRSELVGRAFDRALGPSEVESEPKSDELQDVNNEDVLEVRSPLVDGNDFLGTLAVGFSLEPIERQVRDVAGKAALVALVLMLGNSIMTALYVETLIRPILNLNQTMNRAGEGDLTVRAPTRRGDEVAELAEVFNRMMAELETAREREELQRAQLAQTEKMVAVGTLAAGVAHEVNNPLAGVLASIENMRDNPDDEEMRDRYLQLIADGLKRIERTVANLLNFSRPREIKLERTSINHNLRHVVELVGYQLRASGVEVEMDLDSNPAAVEADHFQMEQLFLNLVLNALDAMREGGKLYLRTRVRGGKVIAEVRDTGHGIPAEVRDRIFDPFFTTREVGEGTGLGLAVSGSIVAAHGGRIELETSVGRGTTFRVIMTAMADDGVEGEAG
jgi:two-component system NtrC family sensor kinase